MTNQALNDLDSILEQLGGFGKYNVVNYALFLFPIYLAGMYASVYIFEAPDLHYRCNVTECWSEKNVIQWLPFAIPEDGLAKCKRYPLKQNLTADEFCTANSFNTSIQEKCTAGFVYDDDDSVVKDFDLGCQDWKRTLVGSLHNAGLFISLPLTGFISDKYGRKKALVMASLMNGLFGILRSFSVNYAMLVTFEFLEAALGAGAYTTAFVMAMELVGPKGRVFGNTVINAIYVCGLMTLAGLAWVLQSWRSLLRIIYPPALLMLSYLLLLNESIRWLLSKGRQKEAIVIIKKAAKMNKVTLSDQILVPMFELENKGKNPDNTNEMVNKGSGTLRRVLKSRVLRFRLIVCSFLWITCTFVYYGLSINAVSLAGNKYVNFMVVGFVEIPANCVCLMVLDHLGRKKTLIINYVLSAILCIGLSSVPKDYNVVSLIVYLSGKFCITIAYSSLYVYVSEVFPTSVRQSLLAGCSSIGRVGSTLAPLTPLLALYYKQLPSIFFGCMALIAGLLVFTIPETINMKLPDTVEEAERMSKAPKTPEEVTQ